MVRSSLIPLGLMTVVSIFSYTPAEAGWSALQWNSAPNASILLSVGDKKRGDGHHNKKSQNEHHGGKKHDKKQQDDGGQLLVELNAKRAPAEASAQDAPIARLANGSL